MIPLGLHCSAPCCFYCIWHTDVFTAIIIIINLNVGEFSFWANPVPKLPLPNHFQCNQESLTSLLTTVSKGYLDCWTPVFLNVHKSRMLSDILAKPTERRFLHVPWSLSLYFVQICGNFIENRETFDAGSSTVVNNCVKRRGELLWVA